MLEEQKRLKVKSNSGVTSIVKKESNQHRKYVKERNIPSKFYSDISQFLLT